MSERSKTSFSINIKTVHANQKIWQNWTPSPARNHGLEWTAPGFFRQDVCSSHGTTVCPRPSYPPSVMSWASPWGWGLWLGILQFFKISPRMSLVSFSGSHWTLYFLLNSLTYKIQLRIAQSSCGGDNQNSALSPTCFTTGTHPHMLWDGLR